MALRFRWDSRKALSNERKHGVRFEEATTAFDDALSVTIEDPDHSMDEHRFVLIGLSNRRRLLIVVHSEQGKAIRIISARRANRQERQSYEEK
jgi:hypothetical protein